MCESWFSFTRNDVVHVNKVNIRANIEYDRQFALHFTSGGLDWCLAKEAKDKMSEGTWLVVDGMILQATNVLEEILILQRHQDLYSNNQLLFKINLKQKSKS